MLTVGDKPKDAALPFPLRLTLTGGAGASGDDDGGGRKVSVPSRPTAALGSHWARRLE